MAEEHYSIPNADLCIDPDFIFSNGINLDLDKFYFDVLHPKAPVKVFDENGNIIMREGWIVKYNTDGSILIENRSILEDLQEVL